MISDISNSQPSEILDSSYSVPVELSFFLSFLKKGRQQDTTLALLRLAEQGTVIG